jgi:hypothetical protein
MSAALLGQLLLGQLLLGPLQDRHTNKAGLAAISYQLPTAAQAAVASQMSHEAG